MKISIKKLVATSYIDELEKDSISLKISIQRKKDKWTISQKSKLIESMIKGYPVPALNTVNYQDKRVVIDGLQRTTAIMEFYNDEYALEDVCDSLNGKKFSELDDECKKRFSNYELFLMDTTNASEEEVPDLFLRLNNGTALTMTQKARGFLGVQIAEWAEELCGHPLFTDFASFTNRQLKEDAPLECLLQGILLIHACLGDDNGEKYKWKNISRKEVMIYVKEVLSKVSQKQLNSYSEVIKYIEGTKVTNVYEKTFIPVLIVLAKYAMLAGVSEKEFNKYILHMRTNLPEQYNEFKGAGNVSKKKTIGRIKVMIDDFNKFFPEIEKPEICLEINTRRKKAVKVDNLLEDVPTNDTPADVSTEIEDASTDVPTNDTPEDASINDDTTENAPEDAPANDDTTEVEDNATDAPTEAEDNTSSSDTTDGVSTEAAENSVESSASVSDETDAETNNDVSDGTE